MQGAWTLQCERPRGHTKQRATAPINVSGTSNLFCAGTE